MKLLVVDIETTGFYTTDAIVEIAISIVDTKTKEVTLVFDNVIKDAKFVKWKHKKAWIFENTTLTVQDVEYAKPLSYYFDEIQALFNEYKMTAYNKSFDLRFLRREGFVIDDIKCLMKTATEYSEFKDKNGRRKKPSVPEIYNQFFRGNGEEYVEEHRAGQDVLDESKILLHMVKLKEERISLLNRK